MSDMQAPPWQLATMYICVKLRPFIVLYPTINEEKIESFTENKIIFLWHWAQYQLKHANV